MTDTGWLLRGPIYTDHEMPPGIHAPHPDPFDSYDAAEAEDFALRFLVPQPREPAGETRMPRRRRSSDHWHGDRFAGAFDLAEMREDTA